MALVPRQIFSGNTLDLKYEPFRLRNLGSTSSPESAKAWKVSATDGRAGCIREMKNTRDLGRHKKPGSRVQEQCAPEESRNHVSILEC